MMQKVCGVEKINFEYHVTTLERKTSITYSHEKNRNRYFQKKKKKKRKNSFSLNT